MNENFPSDRGNILEIENNIWERTQTHLREILDEYSYKNWFLQTSFHSCQDGILAIRVPSHFFANWLEKNYKDTILEAARIEEPAIKTIQYVAITTPTEPKESKTPAPRASRPHTDGPKSPMRRHGGNRVQQFPGFNPKYTFDRFVVGSNNRFAHAAAKAVVESPGRAYNPLFLYGATGLGKTHLMQAIGQSLLSLADGLKVVFISPEAFTNQMIESIAKQDSASFRAKYRKVDVLLIDDIHFLSGKEGTQEEFFHTFNTLFDAHKQIIISSDRSPKEIKRIEERLVSRFEWGLVTDIQPPDLETRIAILQTKARLEHIDVSAEIIRFIATYVTKNIRELEGALVTSYAYSKLSNEKISMAMVENVLQDLIGSDKIKPVTVEQIQRTVAEYFDVRIADLRGKSRKQQVVYPRQLAMYLCKVLVPGLSLSDIGEHFGGRDHTTVLYACSKIEKDAASDRSKRQTVEQLTKTIRG
ncbi:MAG: chromosomal replication initiator protein DnaA [Candidatus Hydrogenedentes bacterium]|nr:chromosomal replication initiator protein DnaA [Candidatus Hydrogenedentota bacterium]